MKFTLDRQFESDFEDVVAATTEALSRQDFGILTEADMAATFQERIGEEFPEYRILGACNSPMAHEALSTEKDLGTVLPCNVIVYEDTDGSVAVSAIHPETVLGMADLPELDDLAEEASERIVRALDDIDEILQE